MLLNPSIFSNFSIENFFEITTFGIKIVPVTDDTNTHDVISKRDVPKPTRFVLSVQDHGRVAVWIFTTFGAFVIGPDGGLS